MADEKPKVEVKPSVVTPSPPAPPKPAAVAAPPPVVKPSAPPPAVVAPVSLRDEIGAKLRDLIRSDSSKERHAIANAILDLLPE